MIGAFGPLLIFLMSVAGFAIWGLPTSTYFAHSLLVVWTETSNGRDSFRWPSGETVMDWLWKPIFLFLIISFWLIPGCVLVGPFFLHDFRGFLIAFGLFLWIVFPLSLFSMLESRSWVMIVSPTILARMVRRPFACLFVGFMTIIPTVLALICFVGVVRGNWIWIFPASIVIPFAWLFYARMWGIYGYLIHDGLEKHAKKKKKRRTEVHRESFAGVTSNDPWAPPKEVIPVVEVEEIDHVEPDYEPRPEDVEDEWTVNKKPYRFMSDEASKEQWNKNLSHDLYKGEYGGYDVGEVEGAPVNEPPRAMDKYLEERRRIEEERAAFVDDTFEKFGKRAGSSTFLLQKTAFQFFTYDATIKAYLNLAVLTLGQLLFLYMILRFFPGDV